MLVTPGFKDKQQLVFIRPRSWFPPENFWQQCLPTATIFSSCVNRFLTKKYEPLSDVQVNEERVEKLFFLPYIGQASVIFGNKLKRIFKAHFLIDVKIVYSSFKVKNNFSLKCRTPLPLVANVVYKFQCSRDADITYIGKTKRHLVTRVREHGTSAAPSAIKEHIDNCKTCKSDFSLNNFTVIDHARNDYECCIKEAIHIKLVKPPLNTQLSSEGMSYFLSIFWAPPKTL